MSVQRRPRTGDPAPGRSVLWVVRYRDYAGKEHSETYRRKKIAYDRDAEIRRDLARGTWVDPTAASITLTSYVDDWAARPGRASTCSNRRFLAANLGRLGTTPLRELRTPTIRAWTQELTTGRSWRSGSTLSPTTARNLLGQLRGVLSTAVADGLIITNPAARVRVADDAEAVVEVQERDVPDSAQYAALHAVSPEWFRTAMEWAALTGLRAGEVAGLTWGDVVPSDDSGAEVSLRRQCPRRIGDYTALKSRSSYRSVPVPSALMVGEEHRAMDPVVSGAEGHGTSTPMICTQMAAAREAVKAAGGPDVSRVTFHGFRHLYASTQLGSGVPLPMVSALLGHKSTAITAKVYAHWLPGQREKAAAAAEAMAGQLLGV